MVLAFYRIIINWDARGKWTRRTGGMIWMTDANLHYLESFKRFSNFTE